MIRTRKHIGMRNGFGATVPSTDPELFLPDVCWAILSCIDCYYLFLHEDYTASILWYYLTTLFKFVPNNTHRLAVVTFVTAIAFNLFSKEWDIPDIRNRFQPPRRVANQMFKGAVQLFLSIVVLPLFEFYQNFDKIDSDAEDRWNVFYGYAKIWWKVLYRLYQFIQQNDQAA
ncbi:hypothetical protein pipiens_013308 [Culex pipiens pipiens]|uniref:Uncharacterized protein n=1 Tax=Culex pipiens pipiens TaxID=38569 RepID=A0ABD1CYX8_CULPP